jgi:HPt (histidine-containing phosphotransfer) domain-containing protein
VDEIRFTVDRAIADLVPQYIDDRRNGLTALAELLVREEFGEIGRYGHQLAGSGKAFGFAAISSIGQEIEAAAERGDAEGVATAVHRLREYLDALTLIMPDSA